jgi:hypothetical protein
LKECWLPRSCLHQQLLTAHLVPEDAAEPPPLALHLVPEDAAEPPPLALHLLLQQLQGVYSQEICQQGRL